MVWWDYGPSGPLHDVTFGPIVMILVIIIVVLAALWLARSTSSERERGAED